MVVKFSVWRPYRQLTGDILLNAGNSRIKLNFISLEASATPPPANPEISAPGVRRFFVKGPVYDVTSSWRPNLNKDWIRCILTLYYSCWKSE